MRLIEDYPRWRDDAKIQIESASSENEKFKAEKQYKQFSEIINKYSDGVQVSLNDYDGLEKEYLNGNFITAYFPLG